MSATIYLPLIWTIAFNGAVVLFFVGKFILYKKIVTSAACYDLERKTRFELATFTLAR